MNGTQPQVVDEKKEPAADAKPINSVLFSLGTKLADAQLAIDGVPIHNLKEIQLKGSVVMIAFEARVGTL